MDMTLDAIGRAVGGEIDGDEAFTVRGVNALDLAGEHDISYVEHDRYRDKASASRAGALVVTPGFPAIPGKAMLRCEVPRATFVRVMYLFHPLHTPGEGISRSAVVSSEATLGQGVSVGDVAVVGERVRVGEGTRIEAGARIGGGTTIGRDCYIGANVVIHDDTKIGDRVRIHAGAVIGGEGFGNVPTPEGLLRVPQIGIVVMEDDVDIGCNTCIDRATFGETRIGRGTKIDNLVQIAHNVTIGEHCLIVAQSGMAGSATLGNGVVLAGQVAVSDHVRIGDRATIAGQAGVTKDVAPGAVLWGTPARPFKQVTRELAALGRLPGARKDREELEKRLRRIESAQAKEEPPQTPQDT